MLLPNIHSYIPLILFLDNKKTLDIGPNDKIVASTRVSIPQGNGPITAESVIEAIPSNEQENIVSNKPIIPYPTLKQSKSKNTFSPSAPSLKEIFFNSDMNMVGNTTTSAATSAAGPLTNRKHVFSSRTFLKPDVCFGCQKK